MLGAGVFSGVAFGLVFNMIVDFSAVVNDGAAPTTFHKGRCHMIKGRSCSGSFDLLLDSTSPKITLSHRMHESTADA